MKSPGVLCCILVCLSWLAPSWAAGRIGQAEVREGAHGVPCFTISEREERRGEPDFDAVTVRDAGKRTVMWKMAMPATRTFPVRFSMCVPYAGRVQALPQTPAAPLEPGKVYAVRIDARKASGLNVALAYEARFCLARQPDGSVLVHQIGRDARAGRDRYGCLAPAN
jgi:hypothetical protein